MTLTTFRKALQTALQTGMGVQFVAGMVTAASPDRDIGCVWVAGTRPWSSDRHVRETVVHARVFVQFEATQGYQQGDIDQLEQLAEQFETVLKPLQSSLDPWFFLLGDVELLIEEHGVEATLTSYDASLFTQGG